MKSDTNIAPLPPIMHPIPWDDSIRYEASNVQKPSVAHLDPDCIPLCSQALHVLGYLT